MNYQIVTDSSCNLSEELIDQLNLEILPLTFRVDEHEYRSYLKGEKTDLGQFYAMMREGKIITTSLPNMQESENTFANILESGKDVLYLGFSSALSGTFESTRLLLEQMSANYPQRKLKAVETLAASGGQGLLVYLACKKAEEGASLEEVAQFVEEQRNHICHWFTVDDLMFLMRGGRVSKASAVAGTMLNIKPVLHVDDNGALTVVDKVRGRKKSLSNLVEHMKATAINPEEQTIFITHGDCAEDVETLKNKITKEFGITDYVVNYIDPVIGAHSGPGTLALFYIGTEK